MRKAYSMGAFALLLEFQRDFAASIAEPATGAVSVYRNTVISGNIALSNDEGAAFTGPLNPAKVARIERGNPFSGDSAIDINDGDFVTLAHLTLTAARHGVWVHNTSVNFTGLDLTVFSNTEDGLRVEGDSVGSVVDRLTAYSNGRYGVLASVLGRGWPCSRQRGQRRRGRRAASRRNATRCATVSRSSSCRRRAFQR